MRSSRAVRSKERESLTEKLEHIAFDWQTHS